MKYPDSGTIFFVTLAGVFFSGGGGKTVGTPLRKVLISLSLHISKVSSGGEGGRGKHACFCELIQNILRDK